MAAPERSEAPEVPGRRIWAWSWIANAVFAATAIPAAAGIQVFDAPAVATALALFAISLGVWGWAFGIAVVRSANGDDIVVGSMFFTAGAAPPAVRRRLFGALAVCLLVTFGTAVGEPFGVLVPMLQLGLVGLWAARHGTFPPRPTPKGAGPTDAGRI